MFNNSKKYRELTDLEMRLEQEFPIPEGYHWVVVGEDPLVTKGYPTRDELARPNLHESTLMSYARFCYEEWWHNGHRDFAPALHAIATSYGERLAAAIDTDTVFDHDCVIEAADALVEGMRRTSHPQLGKVLEAMPSRDPARQILHLIQDLPLPDGASWKFAHGLTIEVAVDEPDQFGVTYSRELGKFKTAMETAERFAEWVQDTSMPETVARFQRLAGLFGAGTAVALLTNTWPLSDVVGNDHLEDALEALGPLVKAGEPRDHTPRDVYRAVTGGSMGTRTGFSERTEWRRSLTARIPQDFDKNLDDVEALASVAIADATLLRGPEFAEWADNVLARIRNEAEDRDEIAADITRIVEQEFA